LKTDPTRARVVHGALSLLALALACCGQDEPTQQPPGCDVNGLRYASGSAVPVDDPCDDCTCQQDGTLRCTDGCTDSGGTSDAGNGETRDGNDGAADIVSDTLSDGSDGSGEAVALDPSCVDADSDSFFACAPDATGPLPPSQDCNDLRFEARPGGYEFPDNAIDDDCDGVVDEPYQCGCTPGRFGGTDSMIAALDFCDGSIRATSTAGDNLQFTVMNDYFGIQPVSGDCFVVLSTGDAEETPGDDSIFSTTGTQPGTSFSEVPYADPDPLAPPGSVYDLGQWTMEIDVPNNVRGLAFDFMFLSAEFPEYLCQEYNDTFHALLESQAVNAGEVTNISFDPQGRQITVNVGYFEDPAAWTVDLNATPMGVQDTFSGRCPGFGTASSCTLPAYCSSSDELDRVGSGSGWLRTAAPVLPGETRMRLTFSIHDEGDPSLDTLVLLDRFEWLPTEPDIGTAKR
jgi:hypothetical protein